MNKLSLLLMSSVLTTSLLIPSSAKAEDIDITPKDFNTILEHEVSPKKLLRATYIVNSQETFEVAMKDMDERLPTRVIVKGKNISTSKLKTMFREYRINFHDMLNYNTLVNYSLVDNNISFQLVDESDEEGKYTARQYEEALDIFAERLAKEVKGASDEESVLNLYNWLYDNFKYNANSSSEMRITNIAEGELACNGFSRLTYEVLKELGIPNKIQVGESHFWNLITLGDTTTTFDVTTDIVLEKRYHTLGTDTDTHTAKTSSVKFYSTQVLGDKTKEVKQYNFNINKASH